MNHTVSDQRTCAATGATTSVYAAVAAGLLACALAASAVFGFAPKAYAAVDPGVYTMTATASYADPDTGAVADSGGSGSVVLGQAMVSGMAQPVAFVENDAKEISITVRFGQAKELGDVKVAASPKNDGSYGEAQACTLVQTNEEANQADYRFTADAEDATFRFTVYVNPMGRDVSFFIKLSDPVAGNSAGFVQTVTDEIIAKNLAEAKQGGSDGLNMPLIVGGVAAAIVLIALIAYFAVIRPGKTVREEAAREAARRERRKQ